MSEVQLSLLAFFWWKRSENVFLNFCRTLSVAVGERHRHPCDVSALSSSIKRSHSHFIPLVKTEFVATLTMPTHRHVPPIRPFKKKPYQKCRHRNVCLFTAMTKVNKNAPNGNAMVGVCGHVSHLNR
jgi:hypothetical protein